MLNELGLRSSLAEKGILTERLVRQSTAAGFSQASFSSREKNFLSAGGE